MLVSCHNNEVVLIIAQQNTFCQVSEFGITWAVPQQIWSKPYSHLGVRQVCMLLHNASEAISPMQCKCLQWNLSQVNWPQQTDGEPTVSSQRFRHQVRVWARWLWGLQNIFMILLLSQSVSFGLQSVCSWSGVVDPWNQMTDRNQIAKGQKILGLEHKK